MCACMQVVIQYFVQSDEIGVIRALKSILPELKCQKHLCLSTSWGCTGVIEQMTKMRLWSEEPNGEESLHKNIRT